MVPINRDEIIVANPLLVVCQDQYGMKFTKNGGEFYASCPFHSDGKRPNFRVNITKNTWFCDVCGEGGSVIDFVMKRDRCDAAKAMEKLNKGAPAPTEMTEVAWYDYTDENGKFLYQVIRYMPKTFRQRHQDANGKWVWGMEGVRRVLYRLPAVLKSESVFIVEGEKDVDNLTKLGLIATCNVGGAKKWLESYSESLKGKKAIVWPDKDDPGREHAEMVIKSLTGKAKMIYRLEVEDKDASEFISRVGDKALAELESKVNALRPLELAAEVPVKSLEEIESDYQAFVKRSDQSAVSLGRFLPTLGREVRSLLPGEVMTILADTGVGKTAILQNIAYSLHPLKVLMFEIELPNTLIFERFIQINNELTGDAVFRIYKEKTDFDWKSTISLSHIYVCGLSKMNPAEMERIIEMSELKIGERPAVVIVDYVGLIRGKGNSRYERMSDVAEQMKILAKSTDTVLIMASQVSRCERVDATDEVNLHDAKDSGSIENSSGVVIGAWRAGDNGETLKLKILKNTKGKSGRIIECNFNGATMKITERADVPKGWD